MAFPPVTDLDFLRVAIERLKDAQCLQRGGRTTGALYVAGYVIECALKALILRNTPLTGKNATLEGFKGSKAHDYEHLRAECRSRSIPDWSKNVHKAFVLANTKWSLKNIKEGMRRYDPGRADQQDAEDLIEAAQVFLTWAQRQLS